MDSARTPTLGPGAAPKSKTGCLRTTSDPGGGRARPAGATPRGSTASPSTASAVDRILHEALTAGPDPLHLALVFNLSHATTSRYTALAQQLLDDQLEHSAE